MINQETQQSFEMMAWNDFYWARNRGFWHIISKFLRRKDNKLLSFEEVYADLSLSGQHELGMQVIEIEKIVGSMGRADDFDRDFYPLQSETVARWISIAKAFYQQVGLPAVELYKIGDVYFVKDGHHRISVAHINGQDFIDAKVIEIEAS